MGLFVCDECGCVENTNCCTIGIDRDSDNGFPNLGRMEMDGFDEAFESSAEEFDDRVRSPQRHLCSECNTGAWHKEWIKSWPTEVELAMSKDVEGRVFTSHPLFKGSYNDLMDSYTLEQFEEDNRKRKEQEVIDSKIKKAVKKATSSIDWMFGNHAPYVREEPKIGRNEPCPCGSGKKHKKCCYNKKDT